MKGPLFVYVDVDETLKISDVLNEMTDGRGPDRCIEAVGAEAPRARSARA